jgi:hypothetical protein
MIITAYNMNELANMEGLTYEKDCNLWQYNPDENAVL